MGTQFWWFYDVIAVAIVLICIFLSARKNALRSSASLAGFILSFFIAFSVSGGIATSFYSSSVESRNAVKIRKTLGYTDFTENMQIYLQSLDYNLTLKEDKLESIFIDGTDVDSKVYKYVTDAKGKKFAEKEEFLTQLHEGYAQYTIKVVSEYLTPYAAESAAEEIRNHPDKFEELIPLLMDFEDKGPAAEYIAKNYVAMPYQGIIRLILFLAVFFILLIITLFISHALGRNDTSGGSIGARVFGGFLGIFNGAALVFAVAVMVRLYVILGDDKMLFFNFEAIDNTYIFKYVYNLVLSL